MRIDIDDTYTIDADDVCTTLIFKSKVTGTGRGAHLVKAENIGKEREAACGYYVDVAHACAAYLKLTTASLPGKQTAQALIDHWSQCCLKIEEMVKKLDVPRPGFGNMKESLPPGPAIPAPARAMPLSEDEAISLATRPRGRRKLTTRQPGEAPPAADVTPPAEQVVVPALDSTTAPPGPTLNSATAVPDLI